MNKILSKEVSFELAQLLKEKEFDKPCLLCYLEDGSIQISSGDENDFEKYNHNLWDNYSAPLIAEVIDFILDKYGISIYYNYNHNIRSSFESPFIPRAFSIIKDIQISLNGVKSPLEAYEEAIKYVLNKEI